MMKIEEYLAKQLTSLSEKTSLNFCPKGLRDFCLQKTRFDNSCRSRLFALLINPLLH